VIYLFQSGAPSQMDLFDPKPGLAKLRATDLPDSIRQGQRLTGMTASQATFPVAPSMFKFARHGKSGAWLSGLLPHTAKMADELCFIRTMHTEAINHDPAITFFQSGSQLPGRPSMGAWVSYGLGSENQNLPAFVAIPDPRGIPQASVNNWGPGFLPAVFQGTPFSTTKPIQNLARPRGISAKGDVAARSLLQRLNEEHLQRNPLDSSLAARIASYELAAHMQTSAAEALDISQETKATHKMYGLDNPTTRDYGTRCLIARRLVERGVRFVQLFLGGQPWDNHRTIRTSLPAICRRTDQPSAALVKDLKQRGMLETTLVHWGGEIGRLPVTQNQGAPEKAGRDHNGQGFSIWLAGGGIKGGMTYGETDEVGHRAVTNIVTPNDYQATLLHLFGLDHKKLVYHHNGQEAAITNNRPSRIVQEILDTHNHA